MEDLFAASKEIISSCISSCISITQHNASYKEESAKLCRAVFRIAALLGELEIQLQLDESLRQSEKLFFTADEICSSLQHIQSLLKQVAHTGGAKAWPLEDSVEFQSVALDLRNATKKLESLFPLLPDDINEDIKFNIQQLEHLQFSQKEFEESEQQELEEVQHKSAKYRCHSDKGDVINEKEEKTREPITMKSSSLNNNDNNDDESTNEKDKNDKEKEMNVLPSDPFDMNVPL